MNKAFTLLELIIVIIIVGVLASLAITRYFKIPEQSICMEAVVNLQTLKEAIDNCYMFNGGNYLGCSIPRLSVDDPTNSPGAHYSYSAGGSENQYSIIAQRNGQPGMFIQFFGSFDQPIVKIGSSSCAYVLHLTLADEPNPL